MLQPFSHCFETSIGLLLYHIMKNNVLRGMYLSFFISSAKVLFLKYLMSLGMRNTPTFSCTHFNFCLYSITALYVNQFSSLYAFLNIRIDYSDSSTHNNNQVRCGQLEAWITRVLLKKYPCSMFTLKTYSYSMFTYLNVTINVTYPRAFLLNQGSSSVPLT